MPFGIGVTCRREGAEHVVAFANGARGIALMLDHAVRFSRQSIERTRYR